MFINQNKTHYNQHIFANENNSVYSCNIKIGSSGFDKFLEVIFLPPAGCESIFPAKIVEMLKEMVASWQEVR